VLRFRKTPDAAARRARGYRQTGFVFAVGQQPWIRFWIKGVRFSREFLALRAVTGLVMRI